MPVPVRARAEKTARGPKPALFFGQDEPFLCKSKRSAQVQRGGGGRPQDVRTGGAHVLADAVQIRRAGHRTEYAFGRRPPKGEADGAGYGEMRRKVRVCAMHFRAVSGEVTQAAGSVHGRIMQLVGRGVDKGPAVCLQYCAHLQPFGRGVRLQRQQRAEQGLLLRL